MPVFISYSDNDLGPYSSLCIALESAGIDYWHPQTMIVGSSLKEQLREAIVQCDTCIFLATRSSIESKWCLTEIGAFWGVGKRVILYKANSDIDEDKLPPILQGDLWTCDVRELIRQTKLVLHIEQERTNINKSITNNSSMPSPELSLSAFAYSEPDWLEYEVKQYFTDIGTAAFVLLALERTTSGCWSKTYLHRRKATGNDLPLSGGSLTGTPIALIALGSYGAECAQIIFDWVVSPLSETLAAIITEDGRYRRGQEVAQMGRIPTYEPLRHAAGGLLSSLLIGEHQPRRSRRRPGALRHEDLPDRQDGQAGYLFRRRYLRRRATSREW